MRKIVLALTLVVSLPLAACAGRMQYDQTAMNVQTPLDIQGGNIPPMDWTPPDWAVRR